MWIESDSDHETTVIGRIQHLRFVDTPFIEEEGAFDVEGDTCDLDRFTELRFTGAGGEMQAQGAFQFARASFFRGATSGGEEESDEGEIDVEA